MLEDVDLQLLLLFRFYIMKWLLKEFTRSSL